MIGKKYKLRGEWGLAPCSSNSVRKRTKKKFRLGAEWLDVPGKKHYKEGNRGTAGSARLSTSKPRQHLKRKTARGDPMGGLTWNLSLMHTAPFLAGIAAASGIVFTSTRHNNKAVQAVHVTAAPTLYPPFPGASSFGQDDHPGLCNTGGDSVFGVSSSIQGASSKPKVHTFTFCLERVDEGALKGIWYTVGVRVGDYTV
eukprot:654514-Pelagomonas_calceolata.AAC.1